MRDGLDVLDSLIVVVLWLLVLGLFVLFALGGVTAVGWVL